MQLCYEINSGTGAFNAFKITLYSKEEHSSAAVFWYVTHEILFWFESGDHDQDTIGGIENNS